MESQVCNSILEGLNPEQAEAARTVRGPVCILAGAGSGKTTTITRRIAHQVASGTFRGGEILAVTFTDKAAGEMRARLAALGVTGVRARTFHAAATTLGRTPPVSAPQAASPPRRSGRKTAASLPATIPGPGVTTSRRFPR